MEPLADNAKITTYKDLNYNSEEEVEDEARNDDIVAKNVVRRGIIGLHKFRRNSKVCNGYKYTGTTIKHVSKFRVQLQQNVSPIVTSKDMMCKLWHNIITQMIAVGKVTPPSTIPKDSEKTTGPKLPIKRKFVSSASVLKQAMPNKKIQKNLQL
ncbi:unnamed protein product [Lactuca virosa]|uniref:Uncharacterized protein n=1 Tax=Lactuca virosa TaxID=75947 RepID=A0AAU9N332_9ASTR|nr:unnamed protein product [Lactuca virosa]